MLAYKYVYNLSLFIKILIIKTYGFFSVSRWKKPIFKIAKSKEEYEAIYRFRYKIYHHELGRQVEGLSHEKEMILDGEETDGEIVNFYYEKNKKIIAVLRMTIWNPREIPLEVQNKYDCSVINNYTCAVINRFITDQSYRNSLLTVRFQVQIYQWAIHYRGICFFLLSCKPGLVPYYDKLGAINHTNRFLHYPDGIEIPMLVALDRMSLKKRGSVFYYVGMKQNLEDIFKKLCENKKSICLDKTEIKKQIYMLGNNQKDMDEALPTILLNTLSLLVDFGAFILTIDSKIEISSENLILHDLYYIFDGSIEVYSSGMQICALESNQFIGQPHEIVKVHYKSPKVIINFGMNVICSINCTHFSGMIMTIVVMRVLLESYLLKNQIQKLKR